MNFGYALDALKDGRRVARHGWNGRGMWLCLTSGSTLEIGSTTLHGAASAVASTEPVDSITIQPHIDMRAADGTLVIGWLASQTDMLSEDWYALD